MADNQRHGLATKVYVLQWPRSKESFARDTSKCKKLMQSNVLCIDYLGSLLEGASLEVQLRKLVDGVQVRGIPNLADIADLIQVCRHKATT